MCCRRCSRRSRLRACHLPSYPHRSLYDYLAPLRTFTGLDGTVSQVHVQGTLFFKSERFPFDSLFGPSFANLDPSLT